MTVPEKIKTVIWGAFGHATIIAEIIEMDDRYQLIGFLDDVNNARKGEIFCEQKILGGKEQLATLRKQNIKHIALGFGNCSARVESGNLLIEHGFSPLSVFHPSSVVARDVKMGEGSVVLAGTIIDPKCRIGKYCIINNHSTICHNTVIGDGVHICPGVHVAGKVRIGSGSWVGIGSCIINKVTIGTQSYIGAGSVVVKDIPDGVLAYGNPARVIRPIYHSF